MGLPYSESFIILTSTIFVRSTHTCDGQMDRRMDGRQHICYMLLRAKNGRGLLGNSSCDITW